MSVQAVPSLSAHKPQPDLKGQSIQASLHFGNSQDVVDIADNIEVKAPFGKTLKGTWLGYLASLAAMIPGMTMLSISEPSESVVSALGSLPDSLSGLAQSPALFVLGGLATVAGLFIGYPLQNKILLDNALEVKAKDTLSTSS